MDVPGEWLVIGAAISLFSALLTTLLSEILQHLREKSKYAFEIQKLLTQEEKKFEIELRRKKLEEKNQNIQLVKKYHDLEPKPDLSGLDLSESALRGVNLRGANLTGTDLSNADLSFSCLAHANFEGALLINTNLSNCDLSRTDFTNSNLTGANLVDTIQNHTIF
jgi:uncharacterized protein YjbI with pentapeptide repeats